MKKVMIMIVVLAGVSEAQGAYTYTYGPGTYFGAKTLNASDSVLVNGGGGDFLTLADHSTARIESTSVLAQYSGGIWEMQMGSYGSAVVTGGEFHYIYVGDVSRLTISGGSVQGIVGTPHDLPAIPEDKYIQFICKSYDYTPSTKTLTGIWGNDQPFSMLLSTTPGYPTTFDSINFTIVPEPLTLGILAFGGLLVRRYGRNGCLS